jgi:DNA-binding NarL/FixJ family response regulator
VSSILVVDSDPDATAYVSQLLTDAGFDSRHATSGEEALASVRRNPPQLILLEVRLPGISGYEVLRELRNEFGEELPVMFLSAERAEATDRIAGLLLGADDYLAKPFAPDELTARVRRLLVRSNPTTVRSDEPKLTRRETDVLRLLARGLNQTEIAQELVISSKTVATHIQNILSKLGVHSRAQAVAAAHRSGFLLST